MLPNLFTSTNIPALGEVLNFAQARHGVLVGNLANINTPGYHVRDLSVDTFQQKLKEAMSQSRTQSQTTADNCCAASEKDTAPLPSPLVLDGAIALVASPVQVVAPTTVIQPQPARTIPPPGAQVRKHLLLSVFLV